MARQVRKYQFTITAGTTKTAPATQTITFPPMVVDQINVKVPPGPNGTMGFAIGSSGQAVIPNEADTWIVADDQDIEFPLEGFWDSGSWELFGYNEGQYDHTIYLTFLLSLVPTPSGIPSSLIPAGSLSSVGGAGTGGVATLPSPTTGPISGPSLQSPPAGTVVPPGSVPSAPVPTGPPPSGQPGLPTAPTITQPPAS